MSKNTNTSSEKKIIYASMNLRLVASMIDTILSLLILSPIVYTIYKMIYGDSSANIKIQQMLASKQNIDIQELSIVLTKYFQEASIQMIAMGVVIIFFWKYLKATPGKSILFLEVVDAKTFKAISWRQAIIRFFGYFISTIPLCLGFIWIIFDKKRQGWHDKLAGTVVIKKK